jgi:uncharacterized protein YciI
MLTNVKGTKMLRLLLTIAIACSVTALAIAETRPEPETRAVFLVHPGPANPPGKSLMENPQIRDHAMHMVKLFQTGKMTRGGPFTDGSGGIGIAAKGVSTEELTLLLAEDPAAKAGLVTYEVKTWMIGVGAP